MIAAMVITLREGIEAALVVGIILAYITKTGRDALRRMVYWGLGTAVVASIALALVLQVLGIDPEIIEGPLLGIAGIMVATLVLWMWRTAKNLKGEMERKLNRIVEKEKLTAQGWGLLAFTFFMVFREGAETVLFLMSATLGQFSLLSLIGGALGIGMAVLFAIFFIKGSLRINLPRFFAVTSIVLLILALKLILGSLHEFAEKGIIWMNKGLMTYIGYFVRDNTSTAILMALLAIPLIMILWDAGSRQAIPRKEKESPVERRKRLAIKQREIMWRIGLMIAAVFILLALGSSALAGNSFSDPQPVAVTDNNGEVTIPIASLEEGKLTKFAYSSNGVDVKFLAVRLADGSVSTSLDACQICGAVGYGQDGEIAICKNCQAPIAMSTIGQGGGCNPLPLETRIMNNNIVIQAAELAKAGKIFK